ncbi:Reverse transcriptase domain-containing protein [Aphis craccivora]|uniref:Reverse transcriptase domain-containing protein n=1 Tax=Aphis craccivora TaxID=307492 RepID=A0A6G0ZKP7_APHCR|nr:Reverse transcriptase domain-containing protein [Aphis craccivora]
MNYLVDYTSIDIRISILEVIRPESPAEHFYRVVIRLIKTYVWSVALYGSETWTINKKEKAMLEALEMWCWRKMQRISWTDRRSNEDILRIIDEK